LERSDFGIWNLAAGIAMPRQVGARQDSLSLPDERDFIRAYAGNYYFWCSLVDFAYTRMAVGSITLALARSGHSRHPRGGIAD